MNSTEQIIVNPYSLTSYYIALFFNDIKLSNATGFFCKRGNKRYFITNWHVVSGKDADTFQCLDKHAAIPNMIHVYLPYKTIDGTVIYDDNYVTINLLDNDGGPVWYEMKKENQMIDIAIIPIQNQIDKFILDIEDAEEPFNENVKLHIADEIYIIVFPFGKIGGELPIWKKASVASEPNYNLNDMPYFFADTATRSGMSGSPVILYEKRPAVIVSSSNDTYSKYRTKFVGVYSGRIGANTGNSNDAQLGRIWKEEIIKTIIDFYEN